MADPAQTPSRGNWVCPCSGCKKARKQAFDEILDIINKDHDYPYHDYLIREKLRNEYPAKPIKK
jgi:predicted RNA-binding protein YlxR (DUF448 family)